MPSNHFILCYPLLLLPSVFPSIRVFSIEPVLCIMWPKYWSFSFNICPSSEYSGLISFRMDWLNLLAVQGTLRSLLQHHSSKASVLWRSAFFIIQLSHSYVTAVGTVETFWSGKVSLEVVFDLRSLRLGACHEAGELGETKYGGPMKGRGSCVGEKHKGRCGFEESGIRSSHKGQQRSNYARFL